MRKLRLQSDGQRDGRVFGVWTPHMSSKRFRRWYRILTTDVRRNSTASFCAGGFFALFGVCGLCVSAWFATLSLPLAIVPRVPLVLGVLSLVLGVTLVRGGLRLRLREHPDNCSSCAYNLTGNVSGVCPECGTKIESP